MKRPRARWPRLTAMLLCLTAGVIAGAEAPPETVGKVVVLPARPGPHWFWLSDILLHRTALFNLPPVTSLSIVDVKARRFTTEVPTPGCSLVYAAGPRRFLMLCANGAALIVVLDDAGQQTRVERSQPFFDPQKDPVTEKAVR